MDTRHQVIHDKDFWLKLEFSMLLQPEKNEKVPRYWIDGFISESVRNTKKGISVAGKVWIVDGQTPSQCQFEAEFPQKLLNKKIVHFEYKVLEFSP